jgi:hypothetical protein
MPSSRIIGLLGFLVFFVSTSVFAQSESLPVSSFHSDQGLKLAKEGEPQQAADQFIQSLFFAPSNQVAKDNLLSLAQKENFESKSVKMQILRFVELADYITFLRERLEKLENENKESIQLLLQQAKENDPRQLEIRKVRSQLESHKLLTIRLPEEIQDESLDRGAKLMRINKYFTDVKESLVKQFSMNLSAYERINALKNQVATAVTNDYEGQLTAVKRQVIERNAALKKEKTHARMLEADLDKVRKKVADLSMQVYEKDELLAERNNSNGQLNASLNDANQRWELAQKIIQEKDDQIKGWEAKAGKLNLNDVSSGGMNSLEVNLSALQNKMDTAEKTNHEMISSLKKELALLQEEYKQLETTSQEKDLMIAHLRDDVTARARKLANMAGFFNSYDKDITQLNGIVEIYKGKLSSTRALLTDKDQKVKNLEKQVADLMERFDKLQQTKLNEIPIVPMGVLGEAEILRRAQNNLERLQGHF